MSVRKANRLFVEEIDEVSSVDVPANQHGLIAIAKRAGATMPFYDADGEQVDTEDIEVGEQVFNEDGVPYTMRSGDELAELLDTGAINEDDIVGLADDDVEDLADERELVGSVGKRSSLGATIARGRGAPAVSGGQHSARTVRGGRRDNLGEPGRRSGVAKSVGQQLLDELRGTLTDADRDQVIAKAFDRIGAVESTNAQLVSVVEDLIAEREGERFEDVAKSYDAVPVETGALAELLATASGTFSKRQLDTLGRIIEAANDPSAFGEVGYNGVPMGSGVLDEINAAAVQVVAKAGNLTAEQAVTELFSANPQAYDEYCAGR